MPPIKLLVGDDKFYGKIKPTGPALSNDQYTGTNKAPPNPLTPNVKYRTKEAQEIAKDKLNDALKDPEPDYPETKDPVKDQAGQVNNIVEKKDDVSDYVAKEKSLGQRFTDFLQGDIVEASPAQKVRQKQRELSRLGVGEEPVNNKIEGEIAEVVGEKVQEGLEAPARFLRAVGSEIQSNITQILILGAGLYLLSSFLQNPALLDRRSAKRNYTKKTAIADTQ